jgi:hypothetical protein
MVLEGVPFSHEINFSTGLPTGAVVYSVLDNTGIPLTGYDDVSVTPPVGALSIVVVVSGDDNTVATPLFETRTLIWEYTTTEGVQTGRVRYRVEKAIPFAVSPDGVRDKLGVEPHDVPDDRIDLLKAYATLASYYTAGALTPYETSGDYTALLISDAIEAVAGLEAIPWMQLSVAKKESSGTNTYERYGEVDWAALTASLTSYITAVNGVIDPLIDPTVLPVIFLVAERDDPLTGTAAGA